MEKRTNNDLHNTKGYSGRGEHHFFNFSVGCGGLLKINSVGGDPMTRKFSG
jgi:hypothetical protein